MESLFNEIVMLGRLSQKSNNLFLNISYPYPHPSLPPDNVVLFDQHGIVLSTNDKIIDQGVCAFDYLDLRCYKRVQAAMMLASAEAPIVMNAQYTLHGIPYEAEIHLLKQDERYLGIIWRTPKLVAFNPR